MLAKVDEFASDTAHNSELRERLLSQIRSEMTDLEICQSSSLGSAVAYAWYSIYDSMASDRESAGHKASCNAYYRTIRSVSIAVNYADLHSFAGNANSDDLQHVLALLQTAAKALSMQLPPWDSPDSEVHKYGEKYLGFQKIAFAEYPNCP